MQQRLALGVALLGEPGILVLDEPANGLDPQGVRWIRELLREHADLGGTVLLSSHLLREVEVIADHLVIINAGRIVADGTPEQLRTSRWTLVRAVGIAVLSDALRAAGRQARMEADGALTTDAEPEQVGRIAARAGAVLTELRPQGDDLEELFSAPARISVPPRETRCAALCKCRSLDSLRSLGMTTGSLRSLGRT